MQVGMCCTIVMPPALAARARIGWIARHSGQRNQNGNGKCSPAKPAWGFGLQTQHDNPPSCPRGALRKAPNPCLYVRVRPQGSEQKRRFSDLVWILPPAEKFSL